MKGEAGPAPGLTAVVEALLFAAARPLTVAELAEAAEADSREEVRHALTLLAERLQATGSALELVEVAGGWRLQTRPPFAPWIKRLLRRAPRRMSRAALETLALIAYRQPITRAEIEAVRGVDSSGTIRFLLDQGLVRMAGRKEAVGRPILYATTRRFLELFQLKDLKELPSPRELEELEAHSGQEALPLFGVANQGRKESGR